MTAQDEYRSPCPGCLIALPISSILWAVIILVIVLIARLV